MGIYRETFPERDLRWERVTFPIQRGQCGASGVLNEGKVAGDGFTKATAVKQ